MSVFLHLQAYVLHMKIPTIGADLRKMIRRSSTLSAEGAMTETRMRRTGASV